MNVDISMNDTLKTQFLSEAYAKGSPSGSLLSIVEASPTQDVAEEYVRVPISGLTRRMDSFNKLGSASKPSFISDTNYRLFTFLFTDKVASIPLDHIGSNPDVLDQRVSQILEAESRRTKEFKEVALAKILLDGTVHLNGQQEILEAEANAGYQSSIDFAVPSSQRGQLNIDGTNQIGATWADVNTDIMEHLDNIVGKAGSKGCPTPKHIFANYSMKSVLRKNKSISDFIKGSPAASERTLKGETIEIGNFVWHFIPTTYPSFDGTRRPLIPTNRVIITPNFDGTWFKYYRGKKMVPTNATVDMSNPLASYEGVYGDFAYAGQSLNPVALQLYTGSLFLPAIVDVDAVFSPTVVF
ncbi:MAG: major capsid protein [Candidatus Obscuribacterales bacterium]|nr:major capsid protein [Candidatus Obscuribacterales bacterium]